MAMEYLLQMMMKRWNIQLVDIITQLLVRLKRNITTIRFTGDDTVTYSDWGRGWYVVSGVKDGKVYYIYCIVGEVTVSTMRFEYPYDQKDQYDWMIPVLVENFHSGNMGV